MERIGLTASEEMSFENVNGRTDDGRTPDACIYDKLTYEPSAQQGELKRASPLPGLSPSFLRLSGEVYLRRQLNALNLCVCVGGGGVRLQSFSILSVISP